MTDSGDVRVSSDAPLRSAKVRAMRTLIDELPEIFPEHAEIRLFMADVLPLSKSEALILFRQRLPPEVLVSDAVVPYRIFFRSIIKFLEEYGVKPLSGPLDTDDERCISAMYVGPDYEPWLIKARERLDKINAGRATGGTEPLRVTSPRAADASSPRRMSSGPSPEYIQSLEAKRNSTAAARSEYELIVTRERMKYATNKKPPALSASIRYRPGDLAYLYSEKLKRYTRPHMVASAEGKEVRLHLGDPRGPRSFNVAQLRPAPLPNAFAERLSEPPFPFQVLHTEVLKPGDEREELFDDEKRKELQGLINRGVFRVVIRQELPADANIVPSRYVLAIKHGESGQTRLKARFVIGGHRDRQRQQLVHDSPTVRPESTRMLVALATILGLPLVLADWAQGYAQSQSPLLRKVFTRPNELDLAPDELVQIVRPCYGLSDAGDYWSETLRNHLRDNLRFQHTACDLSLWIRHVSDRLVAMSATYVDDVLLAAEPAALRAFKNLSSRLFDVSFDESDVIRYIGVRIDSRSKSLRKMSQPRQIERLKLLPAGASFEQYRSARAAMAWMLMTRPDVACAISFAARVQKDLFSAADVSSHNVIVRYLRRTSNLGLLFPQLDASSLRLVVYIDASYSKDCPARNQLGYIICLADKSNRCAIIAYSSRKPRRIARSTTAAEALAFAAGFDNAFALHHDLQCILHCVLPLVMVTDSEILFNIITRRRITAEKRLMIDLLAARQAFDDRVITNIVLIESGHNPADSLTKIKGNNALLKLLKTSKIDHPLKQFITEPIIAAPKLPQASAESGCV